MRERNVAVILAGGVGSRAGFSRPKQLVKLAGSPVLAHTLRRFQEHPAIDDICVVSEATLVEDIERLAADISASKVSRILVGGRERKDSSMAAIRAYAEEAAGASVRLIFHDAVRPLIGSEIIDRVVEALSRYNAVDVAIPSPDTVIRVDPVTNLITSIPDRTEMRLGQTPQAFAYATIAAAYEAASQSPGARYTDDCGVVHQHLPDEPIFVVRGDLHNSKLTYPEDLLVLDRLVHSSGGRRLHAPAATPRLSELRGRSLVVFGGTSGIGEKMVELAQRFGIEVAVASRRLGVDIAHGATVSAFLDAVHKEKGRIDAVVNAAAVLQYQPLESTSDEDVLSSINTNYVGAVNIAKSSLKHLRETRGHLMFFASSSYTFGRAHYSLYSSSKAAIVNLSQALADEWAGAGVKVNCVNPERTATPMRLRAFGAEPADQLLDPEQVALDALGVLTGHATGHVYDISRR